MPVEQLCVYCGRLFQAVPAKVRAGGARYCSRACANAGHFRGRKQSPEFIAKRAEALRGRRPSEQCLARANEVNRGKEASVELREIRRANALGRWSDPSIGLQLREHYAQLRRGYRHSEETKEAIRTAHRLPEKRQAASERMRQWYASLDDEQKRAVLKKRRPKRPTRIEQQVELLLKQRGVAFEREYPIPPYCVDFYVPALRLIVECDGAYWHSLPGRAAKDLTRDEYLKSRGYEVIRIAEEVIRAGRAAEMLPLEVANG